MSTENENLKDLPGMCACTCYNSCYLYNNNIVPQICTHSTRRLWMVQTSTSSSRSEDYDLQDVVMEDMRRAADYQQQLNSEAESEGGEEIDTMLKNDSEIMVIS